MDLDVFAMPNAALLGRTVLTAKRPAELNADTVALILRDALPVHLENAAEIDYLHWYYRGNQPILQRSKPIRPEIKNIVLENRAYEIVEFKKGYEFSHPIQYTNAGTDDSAPIDMLNTYARIDGKEAKDVTLAEWMYKCGTGYRSCLPARSATKDEAPYFSGVLDPRNTFVVYESDTMQMPILAASYAQEAELGNAGRIRYRLGVYAGTAYYEWLLNSMSDDPAQHKPIAIKPNLLGIPIIEYPLNDSRMGYVELCMHLFNAINNIGSNRMDAIEQFVQAYLVFVNCELPENEAGEIVIPKMGSALRVASQAGDADVKFIATQLDQSHTQITKEDLLDAAYEICGVPDRKTRSSGGGDTGQAVVLRDGWGAAEARAKTTEKLFRRSEMEYLKKVLFICRERAASEIGGLSLRDIDVRFTRNRSDNMLVKAQTLEILLRNGVNPEDAYEYAEIFGDSCAVWNKSRVWQLANGWKAKNDATDATKPQENNKEDADNERPKT